MAPKQYVPQLGTLIGQKFFKILHSFYGSNLVRPMRGGDVGGLIKQEQLNRHKLMTGYVLESNFQAKNLLHLYDKNFQNKCERNI